MIRQIDVALISGDFSSRSDFFRVLIRSWLSSSDRESHSDIPPPGKTEGQNDHIEVDLEYGVPDELIKRFEEKAKLENK